MNPRIEGGGRRPKPCPICDRLIYGYTGPHLALRKFKNWSGTWTNSVVCDGKTVAGEKVSSC